MKRTTLFLIILLIAGIVIHAQENPFKKYGVKGDILTLSKGKYKETFYNEDVMQVGTVRINIWTEKIVEFLEPDTTEFAYRAEVTSRFISIDPLCEEYYSWSPYVYVGNNPIKRIDPTGMDWYEDKDGTYQYDPKLTQKNQAQILQKGQSYVGATARINDNKGNMFANFRSDGSIMFANEGAAYARMTTNTKKTGNEEMSVLTNNGTLVLPSYDNTSGNAKFEEYGYSAKNGNVVDAVTGRELNTVALAHTHPDGSGASGYGGDGSFMAKYFSGKPNYVFQMNRGELTGISFIITNSTRPFSWQSGTTGALVNIAPFMTNKNIMSGKYGLSLFTRQNIKSLRSLIPK
jgi:hypothetical protein